ncbi:MAG: leucine-rich repeat domain-containing protein [Oscillospiraceae bacterium]|nr:leucine-rich repeat domain-containing protein [Oscillospiraceae bacterium]
MRKLFNPIILFICVLTFFSFSASASAVDGVGSTSGTCGNSLTWVLDDNGVLTISGSGSMTDYTSSSGTPWELSKSRIKQVKFADTVTSIGAYSFDSCSNLSSVSFPDGLQSIGTSAFNGCALGPSLTLPNSLKLLGRFSFVNCKNLHYIQLSEKLTTIQEGTFAAADLYEITVPEGVISIAGDVFSHNINLHTIHLPASLESVGVQAFWVCDKLSDVYYSGPKEKADAISIGTSNSCLSSATWHCSETLYTLVLPSELVKISEEAFVKTSAQKIIIPENVDIIEARAFADSTALLVLLFEGSPTSIADDILSGCGVVAVYCYKGSSAEIWADLHGFKVVYK